MLRPTFASRLVIGVALLLGLCGGVLSFAPGAARPSLADGPSPSPAFKLPPGIPRPIAPIGASLGTKPVISGVEEGTSFGPADVITLDGADFGGDQTGYVCLRWSRVIVQNAYTQDSEDCNQQVRGWSDLQISVRIDPHIVGVPDESAWLIVMSSDGLFSNWLPVNFVATKTTVPLAQLLTYAQLTDFGTITCDKAADSINTCSWDTTLHSINFYNISGAIGTSGVDRYQLSLSNGWTFDSMNLTPLDNSQENVLGAIPTRGASDLDISVYWNLSGVAGTAEYALHIDVRGPIGVPLQR